MKFKNFIFIAQALFLSFLIMGCSDKENPANGNEEETMPIISSIESDKMQILYGGEDKAVLTCNASGGNLNYLWQVDLGDLIPMNSQRSKVSFTGAECCVGEKIITCTVSNSKGSVSKSITLMILEAIKTPEIISIESEKSEFIVGETAYIECFAIGGNLKYQWEADCGEVIVNPIENSKVTYLASESCKGPRNIKCTVSNEKGTVSQTYQLTIK